MSIIQIILALQILCASGCLSDEAHVRLRADSIVKEIESYRHKFGILPDRLGDLGEPDVLEGPVYYQKEGVSDYKVWYGTEFGESMVYSSKAMKWE